MDKQVEVADEEAVAVVDGEAREPAAEAGARRLADEHKEDGEARRVVAVQLRRAHRVERRQPARLDEAHQRGPLRLLRHIAAAVSVALAAGGGGGAAEGVGVRLERGGVAKVEREGAVERAAVEHGDARAARVDERGVAHVRVHDVLLRAEHEQRRLEQARVGRRAGLERQRVEARDDGRRAARVLRVGDKGRDLVRALQQHGAVVRVRRHPAHEALRARLLQVRDGPRAVPVGRGKVMCG